MGIFMWQCGARDMAKSTDGWSGKIAITIGGAALVALLFGAGSYYYPRTDALAAHQQIEQTAAIHATEAAALRRDVGKLEGKLDDLDHRIQEQGLLLREIATHLRVPRR